MHGVKTQAVVRVYVNKRAATFLCGNTNGAVSARRSVMSIAGSGGLGSPETHPTQCVKHYTQSGREGCREHVQTRLLTWEQIWEVPRDNTICVPLVIVLFVLYKLKGLITRVSLTVSFNSSPLKFVLLYTMCLTLFFSTFFTMVVWLYINIKSHFNGNALLYYKGVLIQNICRWNITK